MSRWIVSVGLVLVAMTAAGCGANVKEIPPVKDVGTQGAVGGDPKERAMKGMPEEMRKKMEAQSKKK